MSLLFQTKTFIHHWLLEVDEHSIHSPFFFDFYRNILNVKTEQPLLDEVEQIRNHLLTNETLIEIKSGKGYIKQTLRSVADQETPPHYCALYYRLVQHLKAKRIVELGTSLGLTALYLGSIAPSQVFTFESNHALANVALTNFEYLDKNSIHLIEGNIESTLSNFLQETGKINFVLINTVNDSVAKYFHLLMKRVYEKSIVVIQGIHQTAIMEKTWQQLKINELVYGSIDLYHCGILFFEPSLNKQHFVFSLRRT